MPHHLQQGDALFGPNTIEPDKSAMAGVALAMYAQQTNDKVAQEMAVHIARVLAKNIRSDDADAKIAPWSFRVNAATGVSYNAKASNTAYPLRLLDLAVEELGAPELRSARDFLRDWIVRFQVYCPEDPEHNLFVGFFEDFIDSAELNRDSWAAMELARYMLERGEQFHPSYLNMSQHLFDYAVRNFGLQRANNVTIMGEQDGDHKPWGGACSKLPMVAALLAQRGGGARLRKEAELALNYMSYFVDLQRGGGCPAALQDGAKPKCGGWQQDAFQDKLVGVIVAMNALSNY